MKDEVFQIVVTAIACSLFLVLMAGGVLVLRDTIRQRGRWGINFKSVRCPECGEPVPVVRAPRNRRQTLWGGHTCEECDTEYDKWGNRVEAESEET